MFCYEASGFQDLPDIVNYTKSHNIGFAYATDDTAANPWDTMPSYIQWLKRDLAEPVKVVRRGVYLSPYTYYAGSLYYSSDYERLGEFEYILGNTTNEVKVIDFLRDKQFNSVCLYNMNAILGVFDAQLRAFMVRLRHIGVRLIEAVGGIPTVYYDNIAAFQNDSLQVHNSPDQMFDGLVTEIEYWQADTVNELLTPVNYFKSLNAVRRYGSSGGNFSLAAYIGWSSQSDVDALTAAMDYIYIHAYRTEPFSTYGYTGPRVGYVWAAPSGANTKVFPIFAASGVRWKPGGELFMGEYLGNHSLQHCESAYYTSYAAANPTKLDNFGGYVWFSYMFVKLYLDDGRPTASKELTASASASSLLSASVDQGTATSQMTHSESLPAPPVTAVPPTTTVQSATTVAPTIAVPAGRT